jgi:hypothetical protein
LYEKNADRKKEGEMGMVEISNVAYATFEISTIPISPSFFLSAFFSYN